LSHELKSVGRDIAYYMQTVVEPESWSSEGNSFI